MSAINIDKFDVYVPRENLSMYNNDDYNHYDTILFDSLKKQFKNYDFKIELKVMYWKEIDVDNVSILVKPKTSNTFHNLITFTVIETCLPYVQYNGIRYATIDRLKYLYYRAVSIPDIVNLTEVNPVNYKCLLDNLLIAEKKYNKTHSKKKGKYRRFVKKCTGMTATKRWRNLFTKVKEKETRIKDTTYKINYPKAGYKTTVEPLPSDDVIVPFRPLLSEKQQKKTKYYKGKTKKKTNYQINNLNVL